MDALRRVIGQAGEHVGEPSLRIDVIELGGGNQRLDGSGTPAGLRLASYSRLNPA